MQKAITNLVTQIMVKTISAFMFVLTASGADKLFFHWDIHWASWFFVFTAIYFLLYDEKLHIKE